MRVALVTPGSNHATFGTPGKLVDPPMGILSLATVLADHHDVRIFDGHLASCRPPVFAGEVLSWKPDVIGFSLNFSTVFESAVMMAKTVRESAPDLPMVVGGNFATFSWREIAELNLFDFVALFEAEQSICELVEAAANDGPIPAGVVDCRNGQPRVNRFRGYIENLDSLPQPNFDLFDDHTRYVRSVVSSRGCVHRCIYCSSREMWRRWRARSAAQTVADMKLLVDKYGVDRVLFTDDIFIVDRLRVKKICSLINDQGKFVSWAFSTRPETLDENLIPILADAGVNAIFLGIESGSDEVLKKMKRRYTAADVVSKIAACERHGIVCTASFIVGLPWETESDVRQTFELMRSIDTHKVLLNIFTPLEGTPSKDAHRDFGIEFTKELTCEHPVVGHGSVNFNTSHLTAAEIQNLWLEGQGIVVDKARGGKVDTARHRRVRYGLFDDGESSVTARVRQLRGNGTRDSLGD